MTRIPPYTPSFLLLHARRLPAARFRPADWPWLRLCAAVDIYDLHITRFRRIANASAAHARYYRSPTRFVATLASHRVGSHHQYASLRHDADMSGITLERFRRASAADDGHSTVDGIAKSSHLTILATAYFHISSFIPPLFDANL